MQLKNIVILSGAVMLVLEVICFALAQTATSLPEGEPLLLSVEYVPYMIAAMTIAFVAFFTLLFAFIFFMLRAELKKNFLGMTLLFLAFVLPIVFYMLIY